MKEAINKLYVALLSTKEASSNNTNGRSGHSHNNEEEFRETIEGGRQMFSSKLAKLEFPRHSDDDPTEWCNRVEQFFEYQDTMAAHKVSLASFHLEDEANQWWQWLRRAYNEEGREVT
jgi:hypothetical protein